jgi:hypothetical protein
MWTLLLLRMITRGATVGPEDEAEEAMDDMEADDVEENEDNRITKRQVRDASLKAEFKMRTMLFDYIINDFSSRCDILISLELS